MRSDHLSKHIKRCQNRESAASRASSTLTKAEENLSSSPDNAGQCTADCAGYSANCPQCQSDQKQLGQEDQFDNFALPAAPLLTRNAPSPTSFSCPASMFYNHFDAAASVQLAQQAVARATQQATNLPISAACTRNLISFANSPFSVFNSTKPNDHSIDSIMFRQPPFKSNFEPSFILNEDSSSCSSLPPQMYFS